MATKLEANDKDLGGFTVKRILPHTDKKMVGPFVFFDHMGPARFPAGKGINVRPHPHIGLATITYLFDGSILHRDSLGNVQEILPGEVNWMTAGKGIVHSERETIEVKSREHSANGLQVWIALPEKDEYIDPSFTHVKKNDLPHIMYEGVFMRLIAGTAYGRTSPVKTYSPMFYLDVLAEKDSIIHRPNAAHETAIYLQSGAIRIGNENYVAGDFVLMADDEEDFAVTENVRLMLLGGEAFEKVPYVHWNFVSFDHERIKQARDDWENNRFPHVPGDDEERIPLPEKVKLA